MRSRLQREQQLAQLRQRRGGVERRELAEQRQRDEADGEALVVQGEAGGAEALPLTQVRPEARVAQGLQHRAADVCVGVCDAHAEQLREDVAHLVWRGGGGVRRGR